MLLQTERLSIRLIKSTDWQGIKEIWSDFDKSPLSQYDAPHITENKEIKVRVSEWSEVSKGFEHSFFAVCLDGVLIGYIDIHNTGSGYDIGYCFHSDYHGNGYAKESIKALVNYMCELGVVRFTAGTALDNIPSVRLLTSLGFKQIATKKISFYKDDDGNDIIFDGGIFEFTI